MVKVPIRKESPYAGKESVFFVSDNDKGSGIGLSLVKLLEETA